MKYTLLLILILFIITLTRSSDKLPILKNTKAIRGESDLIGPPTGRLTPSPEVSVPLSTAEATLIPMVSALFKDATAEAMATFRSESGLRANAQGWNCMYEGKSKACKTQDRGSAWSVDCGIAQLNFKGTTCPTDAFNPLWNITMAYEWKYKGCQCFSAWVAHENSNYLAFLSRYKLISLGVKQ